MAVLRCDGCGGETFEPLSEPGYCRCHACGVSSTVKLAPTPGPSGARLAGAGRDKMAVIKVIAEYTGWDFRQTKAFVDAADTAPQAMHAVPGDLAEMLVRAGAVIDRG